MFTHLGKLINYECSNPLIGVIDKHEPFPFFLFIYDGDLQLNLSVWLFNFVMWKFDCLCLHTMAERWNREEAMKFRHTESSWKSIGARNNPKVEKDNFRSEHVFNVHLKDHKESQSMNSIWQVITPKYISLSRIHRTFRYFLCSLLCSLGFRSNFTLDYKHSRWSLRRNIFRLEGAHEILENSLAWKISLSVNLSDIFFQVQSIGGFNIIYSFGRSKRS